MEDYNVEGLLLLVKALHTSILFILMFFACFFLYFSRLVQVVMKTALTVTLIIMMIVTRIPLAQVRVVAEVVELHVEVVVPEPKELYYLLQLLFLMRDTETHDKLCNKCFYMPTRAYFERKIVVFRICHLFEVKGQP